MQIGAAVLRRLCGYVLAVVKGSRYVLEVLAV